MADPKRVAAGMRAVEAEFGPWTAHDYELAPGLYTLAKGSPDGYEAGGERDAVKLRRIVQVIADHAPRPIDQLRVLDLGCLEGLYVVELGLRGAEVVGIEGRQANLAKARFAKDTLALDRVHLFNEDVRSDDLEAHGQFDVVLCLGLLYHLEAAEAVRLVRTIARMCNGFAIFDTQIALLPEVAVSEAGHTYWGHHWVEHEPSTTADERAAALWKSLDNETSFYFTRPSLCNLLMHSGFSSVYECFVPPEPAKEVNRVTLLAVVGQRERLLAVPKMADAPWADLVERVPEPFSIRGRARRLLPASVKRRLRSVRRRLARGSAGSTTHD